MPGRHPEAACQCLERLLGPPSAAPTHCKALSSTFASSQETEAVDICLKQGQVAGLTRSRQHRPTSGAMRQPTCRLCRSKQLHRLVGRADHSLQSLQGASTGRNPLAGCKNSPRQAGADSRSPAGAVLGTCVPHSRLWCAILMVLCTTALALLQTTQFGLWRVLVRAYQILQNAV